ncbi:MAG: ATP-binding protein [Salinivirgaceae bacterium]|nr:ATP-binding protein [Salinivirgaceae bacterium]
MEIKNYYPRCCDSLAEQLLTTAGALLIEGPKWCGKTWVGRHIANSVLYMQDPDRGMNYRQLADSMPSQLLMGEKPRLIDEWQEAPVLWDAVRFDVDQTGEWGQYILTGSSTPHDEAKPRHTGTGRIARIKMRPMSLWESRESSGSVSLAKLFEKPTEISGENVLNILDIAKIIARGGWPEAVAKQSYSTQIARNYVDAVINTEISNTDGVERNPHRVRQLLRSYARNISTMAAQTTILEDVKANDVMFSDTTMYDYLNALRRIFLIEDVPAWKPSLRSKTAIRTSDKRQLVDPSIAVAVMRADADSIIDDFKYFGFLFESLVTRDLRIYSQLIDGEVFHYRDKNELEADIIIRLHDNRWAAVEVKLGNKEIEEGAKHLLALQKKVDTEKVGEPSFLMIVTGGQFAYRRKDGVYVVPIGCLKP